MADLVSDVINDALVDLRVLAPGGAPSAAVQADCFKRLQNMAGSWSSEQETNNAVYHQSLTLSAGVSQYTFGTGGTLVATATPFRITGAAAVSGSFRNPVKVVSHEEFAATVQDPLATTSVLASVLAADNAYPSINLRVFPVPAAVPGGLLLDYFGPMMVFAAVSDSVAALAPWYRDALHFNLAVALYPQYGRQGGIDPVLASRAQETKAAIVSLYRRTLGIGNTPAPTSNAQ